MGGKRREGSLYRSDADIETGAGPFLGGLCRCGEKLDHGCFLCGARFEHSGLRRGPAVWRLRLKQG